MRCDTMRGLLSPKQGLKIHVHGSSCRSTWCEMQVPIRRSVEDLNPAWGVEGGRSGARCMTGNWTTPLMMIWYRAFIFVLVSATAASTHHEQPQA